jgi:hypothetical protein
VIVHSVISNCHEILKTWATSGGVDIHLQCKDCWLTKEEAEEVASAIDAAVIDCEGNGK